jgi:hypothetical protein
MGGRNHQGPDCAANRRKYWTHHLTIFGRLFTLGKLDRGGASLYLSTFQHHRPTLVHPFNQLEDAPCATKAALSSNDGPGRLILCMLLHNFAFRSFLQIVSTVWRKWRLRASTRTLLEHRHRPPPQHHHLDRESLLSCLWRLLPLSTLVATLKSLSEFVVSCSEVGTSLDW